MALKQCQHFSIAYWTDFPHNFPVVSSPTVPRKLVNPLHITMAIKRQLLLDYSHVLSSQSVCTQTCLFSFFSPIFFFFIMLDEDLLLSLQFLITHLCHRVWPVFSHRFTALSSSPCCSTFCEINCWSHSGVSFVLFWDSVKQCCTSCIGDSCSVNTLGGVFGEHKSKAQDFSGSVWERQTHFDYVWNINRKIHGCCLLKITHLFLKQRLETVSQISCVFHRVKLII